MAVDAELDETDVPERRKSGANLFLDAIDNFDIACRDASASAHGSG